MRDVRNEDRWGLREHRYWWAVPFAVWSVPPLILLLDAVHAARIAGHAVDLRSLAPYTSSCYVWAALTPAILWMGRRFRLSWPNRVIAVVAHVGAILVATTVSVLVNAAVRTIVLPAGGAFLQQLAEAHKGMLPVGSIIYIGSLLVSYSKAVTRKYQARDIEAARLSAQLAQAQLAALRMQLNPHFLFNSLNAIAGLVREHDNRTAVRVLAQLSDVLRHVLSTSAVNEVPLREELEFTRDYLDIERVRFPDRLEVTWRIADVTEEAFVPSLILQPIVENALRHGIHQRSVRGHLSIEATKHGDVLRLVVRDDGRGFDPEISLRRERVGLTNTRARLEQLYPGRGRLSLGNAPEGGAMVIIELPYHVTSATLTTGEFMQERVHV